MFIRVFSFIAVLCSSSILWGVTTHIAATVNNKVISVTDLVNRIRMAVVSSGADVSPEVLKSLQGQILNVMIDEALQMQLAKQYEIDIDPTQIDAAVRDIENQKGMEAGGMEALLKKNNISLDYLHDHLKASMAWRDYIRSRYKEAVQVSEAEVQRALKEAEVSQKERRYELSEIVLRPSTEGKSESAESQARKIVAQVRAGAPFAGMAEQFSNAPSAAMGGQLGWISEKALDPELKSAVLSLTPGSVSEPITTKRGCYILQLKEKLEPGEKAKPEEYVSFKQVMIPFPQDAFEFEVRENMNRAHAISKSIKEGRVPENVSKSKGVIVQTVNKASVTAFPKELRGLLGKLSKGQASEPVFTGNGAVIFVLLDRESVSPHDPTETEIRENLLEKKLQLIAEREMRNRRRSAHIEIRS